MLKDEQSPGRSGEQPSRFRLPTGTRVGGVRLQVSDLHRSVDYYEQVLGLRVGRLNGETVALGPHDTDRTLVTLHSRPGIGPARKGAFGLYHFAILLPDRAALGRFAAHLSAQSIRVGMADHLVSESLYLWDPDGLGIEVYADRPRETWQHRDGQYVMTTDPLDVVSVIAAGEGEPWRGAPAGTTIGHVHLHVGTLEMAEAFYHRGLGFDRTVWDYPGALFMSAGGYHHHLGTNIWAPGPSPGPDTAQLVEWELVLPSPADVIAAGDSVRAAGYAVEHPSNGLLLADPWGTRVRVLAGN